MQEREILELVLEKQRTAAKELIERGEVSHFPFIIKAILLIGAWLSSGVLIFGSGALFNNFLGYLGAILVVAAWGVGRASRGVSPAAGVFLSQVSLVIGLAGKAGLIYVLYSMWDTSLGFFVITAGIVALSYPVFKNSLDRFVLCVVAAGAFFYWLVDVCRLPPSSIEIWSVCVFCVGICIFIERYVALYALGYALFSSCLTLLWLAGDYYSFSGVAMGLFNGVGIANVFLGLALAAFYLFFNQKRTPRAALLVLCILLLSLITNLGVMMGLTLMCAGFFLRESMLENIGTATLVVSLVVLYYAAPGTLLGKAVYLLMGGLILLGVRRVILGRVYAK